MNVPILLTGSRLVLAPLFALFFLHAYDQDLSIPWLWAAAVMMALLELSDMLDGKIARAQGTVTEFGKIFDPICDSLSRQTIFLTYMSAGIIPIWVFLVFLYRDGLMMFLRVMSAIDGTVMAAKKSGKIKAVFQAITSALVLLIVLLQAYRIAWVPETIWGFHPGFWLILLVAIFTFISMFDYYIPNRDILARRMEAKRE
ncbi:MAG: CDP-alcohol phosphatidyltransferase family protein [Fibrobacterota bacterium]